jgi:hypothetical protein
MPPAADLIVLDTLGKLHAHGHVLSGPPVLVWRARTIGPVRLE